MARRKVTHTRKHHGEVTAVGNPDQWWSSRAVADVIIDIDTGLHRYHITDTNGRTIPIVIHGGTSRRHLAAIGTNGKNLLLHHLPDC